MVSVAEFQTLLAAKMKKLNIDMKHEKFFRETCKHKNKAKFRKNMNN